LTLADILELNLPQCYLVCLSACETGVIDVRNNSDEFIGLSSGFMKAGAVNIVSSLWTVSDVHTAILMIKLYENIANNPRVSASQTLLTRGFIRYVGGCSSDTTQGKLIYNPSSRCI
jgi:CHAT domain-containing protein